MSHSEESEEIVDETLLPEKLREKKWIIGNFLGKGLPIHFIFLLAMNFSIKN